MNKAITNQKPKRTSEKEGKFEELYRFLEERYGYPREKAKEELHRRIRR